MPAPRPTPPRALIVAAIALAGGGAAAQKVPDVVVDASAAEGAPRLEARIAEVTVFSDRARVRRRGRVALKGGAGVVRLPDLPGGAFLDTIRVSVVGGGRVLRVEATPVERERLAIDQAVKLLDELDAVSDRFAELDDRYAVDDWELGLLTRLAPAPPVPEEKREGRKGLVVDVPSWWRALDFIGARAGAARGRLVRLADERRQLGERRDRLRADVAKLNQGGFSERVVQVLAVVDAGGAGAADLQLEYFVPGARWKPAYDLHFAMARGQARLETAAVVEQTTGEDWDQAALSFSTAIPGRGIDLPELLTWTLGERSEFVPRPRPRQQPPSEPPLAVLPPPPPPSQAARVIEAQIVRERLARVAGALRGGEQGDIMVGEAKQEEPAPVQRQRRRVYTSKSAPSSAPSGAPAAAPSMAYDDSAEEAEVAAAPRMLGRKSPLAEAPAISRRSVSYMPLGLVDATPSRRPPVLTDPYLPAVSAGGFDYVYQAPTPATVPSTGKQIRIPLASQSFRTTAFYEATPALAPTAFLRARVRNDGKHPLLRGPAAIFGDGEFVGNGEIKTTGASGEIELPLGADQDIRLVRQVVPSTRTTGLVIKTEETTYDVQIQVGNYKKQAVSVEVVDQVPRSRNDKIDVKLLATNPQPLAAMDADGVVRFRVDVPAGATRTITLRYQIARPKDWILYQR